jgi:uncharacterized protein
MNTTVTKNALNWFEIYAQDFDGTCAFYEKILGAPLQRVPMEGCQMAMFGFDQEAGVGGAIMCMEGFKPGGGGTVVYLNVEGKLDAVLARIPAAGGKIIRDRKETWSGFTA